MMENLLFTPRGKLPSISISTRIDIINYQRVLETSQMKGITVSKFLSNAIVAALETQTEVVKSDHIK